MPEYRLSRRADTDLEPIAEFSIQEFGITRARQYIEGLDHCFQTLAETPLIGREANYLIPEVRRFVYQAHVVFYKQTDQGVLIVRVLHRRMDVDRHLDKDDLP